MAEFESAKSSPPLKAEPGAFRAGAEADLLQTAARLLFLVLAAGLAFYFASKAVSLARSYQEIIETAYDAKGPPKFPEAGDITVFYTAGKVIVSDQASTLYDPDQFVPQVQKTQGWPPNDIYAGDGKWSRFYNPPFFALMLSPLTLVDVHTAYLVVLGLNILSAALLVYLIGRIMHWRQPATILLVLALFSFTPIYFVFQHAQPSLLLAVVLAGSFLLSQSGSYRASAVLLVFGGLKPQWLALPSLVVAMKERRALLWSAIGVLLIIVLPFVLVGTKGLSDYIGITSERGSGDLTDQGFSSAILSWSGFLRALTGSPQPVLWGLLSAITLASFLLVCVNGDVRLTTAGAILTTLLVVPHNHPQDWVVVAVVGAIALGRNAPMLSHLATGAFLLAIYFAANDWPNASYAVSLGQHAVYWITPAGAALLFLFVLQPLLESRIALAPAPSIWRLEWEAPALARVQPWHLAGAAFSAGMVLGVASALALVRQPDAGQALSFNASTSALATAQGPRAKASGSYSLSSASARTRVDPEAGFPDRNARATAGGVMSAAEAPDAASARVTASGSAAPDLKALDLAGAQEPTGLPVAEVNAAVSEVSSIAFTPEGVILSPGVAAPEAAAAAAAPPSASARPLTAEGAALRAGTVSPGALDGALSGQPEASALGSGLAPAAEPVSVRFTAVQPVVMHSLRRAGLAGRVPFTRLRPVDTELLSAAVVPGSFKVARGASAVFRAGLESGRARREQLGQAAGISTAEGALARLPLPGGAAGRPAAGLGAGQPGGPQSARASSLIAGLPSAARVLARSGANFQAGWSTSAWRAAPLGLATSAPARIGHAAGLAANSSRLAQDQQTQQTTSASAAQRAEVAGLAKGLIQGVSALSGRPARVLSLWSFPGRTPASSLRKAGAFQAAAGRTAAGRSLPGLKPALQGISALAGSPDVRASVRAAVAQARAVPTPAPRPPPTATAVPDRKNCDEIRATGAFTAGEEAFLRASCPLPQPVVSAPPPPPEPPPPPAAAAAPLAQPTGQPQAARCTRVVVAGRPTLTALPSGGFRLDAEIAPADPAGCSEWPAAFTASASLNVTAGNPAYQGVWSCESGPNPTAGVSAATHFVFFCTIGQRSGPSTGAAGLTIQITALSDRGAVLSTSSQSFPAPSVP